MKKGQASCIEESRKFVSLNVRDFDVSWSRILVPSLRLSLLFLRIEMRPRDWRVGLLVLQITPSSAKLPLFFFKMTPIAFVLNGISQSFDHLRYFVLPKCVCIELKINSNAFDAILYFCCWYCIKFLQPNRHFTLKMDYVWNIPTFLTVLLTYVNHEYRYCTPEKCLFDPIWTNNVGCKLARNIRVDKFIALTERWARNEPW